MYTDRLWHHTAEETRNPSHQHLTLSLCLWRTWIEWQAQYYIFHVNVWHQKSFSWKSSISNSKYFLLSQTCSSKNSCSRKKTSKTPGCPCKNASLKCSSSCTCGTKRVEVVLNRNPSAFSRHREQVATPEREIQVSLVLKYMTTQSLCSVFCHISQWIDHTYSRELAN